MTGKSSLKVALVHPPLRNVLGAATPDYVDENRGFNPPMGLLYLQAALCRSRHESVFIDANLMGWTHEQAAKEALCLEPDLVALQAMTFTLKDAYMTALAVKKISPDTCVMIGGPHPTIYPEETAALPGVDFAFAGEGEKGLVDFLDRFSDTGARLLAPGVAGKKHGRVVFTPPKGLLKNLDSLAFPARKSSHYRRYFSVLAKHNPFTIMITSRGCPYSCVFCNRMDRKYRSHSARYVLKEIDNIVELGIREIFIHDDIFSLEKDRIKDICKGLIQRKYDLVWEARTRVDLVDQRLLELMSRAGCHRLSFGVESGSTRVLKNMRKGICLEHVKNVFAWCRETGMETLADFMIGNLGETMDDIEMTLELVKKIDPDYAQFSICSPYPETPLYQIGRESGLIKEDVWRKYAANPLAEFDSPVWTENFSKNQLQKITASAYRSFYFRPSFIIRQVKNINSMEKFFIMARAAFGILKNHFSA